MKQRESVLFSPIGRTDPLRADADGPFLHILRHYKPRKAVLYLTQETFALHRKDNRYLEMARRVSPDTEYEVIGDETLCDAHRFEIFDRPFRDAIEALHRDFPTCEVLVNITSGTPQMEAALYLLKAILPFSIRAIQVATPAKSSNESEHLSKTDALDFDALYHSLRDNAPDAANRCVVVECENAQAAILKKNILALIRSYDYTAALMLAEGAPELFGGEFLESLTAAKLRLALETKKAARTLSGCFEEARDGLREGYEYILMLDTLVARECYGDYARAISPALVALLTIAIRQLTGLDVYKFCVRKTQGAEWCISPELVRKADNALLEYLNTGYSAVGGFRESPLNADVMIRILEYYRVKKGRKNIDTRGLNQLRNFERSVRNCAAHQITPITQQQVLEWTGSMTVSQAQELLKQCFVQAGGKVYRWDGYARMNALLEQKLES